ncbi:hypothetical protein Bca4012_066345 [Brassica carinata]|uniref:Uncharacterized protein n=1 Tax=Brassica carinata TaxID=52824 RepID=A0A8X7VQI3_BRACI|nr:hypothetical protein Bca52824_018652 [Brassica carinata]
MAVFAGLICDAKMSSSLLTLGQNQFHLFVSRQPLSLLFGYVSVSSLGFQFVDYIFFLIQLSAGSWKPLESYGYNKDEVNQVVCNGRSSFLASADDSGDVKIPQWLKDYIITSFVALSSICSSVQFIPWRPWEVITGGLDSKLVLWDFSKGQCLNPAFVHSIAVPEMDMVDKLGKICAVARGDGIVGLITIAQERE